MRKLLIAAGVVVAALVLATPWWIGAGAEARYQTLLTRVEQQGFTRLEHRYDRGWFSARAITRYGWPAPTPNGIHQASPPGFVLRSRIWHGPWLLPFVLQGDFQPAAARIQSSIDVQAESETAELPLRLDSRIDLDGSGKFHLTLNAVEKLEAGNQLGVRIQEGEGELETGPDIAWMRGSLRLPGVELLRAGSPTLSLTNLATATDSVSAFGNLWLGKSRFTVEAARLRLMDEPNQAVLRDLEVVVDSAAAGNLVELTLSARLAVLDVDGQAYGPSEIAVRCERFAGAVLAEMQQASQDLARRQIPEAQRDLAAMTLVASQMTKLLRHDPRVAIDRLDVTTPQGRVSGRLDLQMVSAGGHPARDLSDWLGRLQGEAELRVPETLVRQLMGNWVRRSLIEQTGRLGDDLPAAPEELEAQVTARVENQLTVLVQQEFVERDANDMVTVARLGKGLLTVNGKTIPLPFGVSMAP